MRPQQGVCRPGQRFAEGEESLQNWYFFIKKKKIGIGRSSKGLTTLNR